MIFDLVIKKKTLSAPKTHHRNWISLFFVGHLVFNLAILMTQTKVVFTVSFVLLYLLAALLQVRYWFFG